MIIGIDGNEANIKNMVGVHRYAYELLWNLYKLQDEWKNDTRFIIYLKAPPLNTLPPESFHWKYKVLHGYGLWIIRQLTPHLLLNKDKIDLFHTPGHYLPPLSRIPMILSIMDLGYLDSPEQFRARDFWQLKLWTARSAKIAKYVIAISEATKTDILSRKLTNANKVGVTLLGYDNSVFHANIAEKSIRIVAKKYNFGKNYVLFLGTLKPSKNIEGIIDSWSLVKNRDKDTKLVIGGKKGWLYESIFEKVKELGLEESVIFTGFLPEEDKAPLIAGAKMFLIPSFWEGFGLDVLSAMACGVPVISSDRGSLPEVGGAAAIYVDPKNPKDIARGIDCILTMSSENYSRLSRKSIRQAQKFSWEKTTRETLKIYNKFRKSRKN